MGFLLRMAAVMTIVALAASPAGAQDQSSATVHGRVTTRGGTVILAGVTVTIRADPGNIVAAVVVTDTAGAYSVKGLSPGLFRIEARIPGFAPITVGPVTLHAGTDLPLNLDVPLALATTVEAVAARDDTPITAMSDTSLEGRLIDIAPVTGDDFLALLPLVPSVVRGPDGRLSLTGGRPAQTGLQISQAIASDPVIGDVGLSLPVDAVSSVTTLPNPYAAEYGRFSSGTSRIETRRGGDSWMTTANNFIPVPCLVVCDGHSWGVRAFDPRLIVTGPLLPHRLFLAQSAQFHAHRDLVQSLPDGHRDTGVTGLDTFTRLDLLAGRHQTSGTLAVFPQRLTHVGLDAFTPEEVAPDVSRRGFSASFFDTWRFSATTVLETSMTRTWQRIAVEPGGTGPMVLAPDGRTGTFFNSQTRQAGTTQWTDAVSLVVAAAGEHFLKAGVDVLQASFDGTSTTGPVEIRREDGTRAARLEFPGMTSQQASATNAALFIQDRWRVSDRLIVEVGMRADRDGVTRRIPVSPRLGGVLGILGGGRGVLRGGVGRFVGQTPLLAADFASIEAPTVERFAADGVTPTGPPDVFINQVSPGLVPASGRVWNLEYDHHLTAAVAVKVNHLERDGTHELIVDPSPAGAFDRIVLSSSGRSRYRETEISMKYGGAETRQLGVTYVRSHSDADLNAFDAWFGTLRNPILQANAYGPTSVDVPNRLMLLAVWPVRTWRVAPLVEIRDGFAYTLLDGDQAYASPRNAGGRLPTFWTADLTISRELVFHGRHLRVGLRTNNLIGQGTERDVQTNVTSPTFGARYNPLVRRIGLTLEVLR